MLQRLNLGISFNSKPPTPESPASFFRKNSYIEIWKKYYSYGFHHIKLIDNSLLYFTIDLNSSKTWEASYTFLECPYDLQSYTSFISDFGYSYDDIGDSLMDDYEESISNTPIKSSHTPIRYDFHPQQYQHGIHPASHFHIGFDNNVRICSAKLITPVAFTHFIIRQHYPDQWKFYLEDTSNHAIIINEKHALGDINNSMFLDFDKSELFMS